MINKKRKCIGLKSGDFNGQLLQYTSRFRCKMSKVIL